MRKIVFITFSFILIVVVIVPTLLVRGYNMTSVPPPIDLEERIQIKVYDVKTKTLYELGLEEYVKGVVAAEMPAQFDLEALKAQAVAARTYAVRKMVQFGGQGSSVYPGADITSDHTIDQAWISKDEMKEKWGLVGYHTNYHKISSAIESTRNEVIVYNQELIDPVYHSTCGGQTENSEDVWSNSLPYLRSVTCPYDEHSNRYTEVAQFTLADIGKRLGADITTVAVANHGGKLVQVLETSSTGRIKSLRVGDKIMKGTDVRSALELRSTRFTTEVKDNRLVFHTIGYGHGVGMCQYGADGMAKAGKNYQDILTHYYTGVEIDQI